MFYKILLNFLLVVLKVPLVLKSPSRRLIHYPFNILHSALNIFRCLRHLKCTFVLNEISGGASLQTEAGLQ